MPPLVRSEGPTRYTISGLIESRHPGPFGPRPVESCLKLRVPGACQRQYSIHIPWPGDLSGELRLQTRPESAPGLLVPAQAVQGHGECRKVARLDEDRKST